MLHSPRRRAEDPCLSLYLHVHGCLGLPRRLMLINLATIRLGPQQDQATAWYASVSPIPKTPIYQAQQHSEHRCGKDEGVAAGHPLLMGEFVPARIGR